MSASLGVLRLRRLGGLLAVDAEFGRGPHFEALGADGVLVPYINTAEEARQAISCCKYPMAGTRSVYFPQRSMNKEGLLGYAGAANDNTIVALQVETHDCIKNIDEIAAVPGVDLLFLGQNDLCMSMGLYEKYEFPHMYTSPELGAATDKLVAAARKNNVALGVFLFGTSRVQEFLDKGFPFISIGNDLHHILTPLAQIAVFNDGKLREQTVGLHLQRPFSVTAFAFDDVTRAHRPTIVPEGRVTGAASDLAAFAVSVSAGVLG